MAKIVLDTVTGGYDLSVINNNFDKIEAEFQNKVLYRNNPIGETNILETDVDANGKRIYNLPEPLLNSEPARLQDIQNAVAGGAANLITFTPYGTVASTNVQAAIQEILDEDVTASELSASSGSSLIGFIQEGTGAATRTVQTKQRDEVSIYDFGAVGDGVANDTTALQNAINYCITNNKKLKLKAGSFKILSSITIAGTHSAAAAGKGLNIEGEGSLSHLIHAFDGVLFSCSSSNPSFFSFTDFRIVSTSAKSTGSSCFKFTNGINRSNFKDIVAGSDGVTANRVDSFFDCGTSSTVDTITFENIFVYNLKGTGFGIGQGSSVWWVGGRIVGADAAALLGTGIKLYGGNGGVWCWGLDCIQLGTGFEVSKDNTINNREIFLIQSALDSCNIGFFAKDDSYISIEGCWAASCKESNINLSSTYNGILNISGGTVFNAGIIAGGSGDGLAINSAARVTLSGVDFRNNVGKAVNCPNGSFPTAAKISSCQFFNNGVGIFAGGLIDIFDNTFSSNTTNLTENAANLTIVNNKGVNTTTFIIAPAMVSSGGTYTYTGNYPVNVFIREGTVSAIWLNGNPIYALTNALVPLKKGDSIRIDYSVAPNWQWVTV